MPVIAMTREMGSLGKDVALGLAEELGLTIVHHELVEHHLAEKLRVHDSTVHRFLEGRPGMFERLGIDEQGLSLYTAEEILDLATEGNVLIRGWGATYLLRPVSHVACVRVCAPLAFRTKVLMERLGIDDEEIVLKEIKRNDAAHARTMLNLFHVDWEDAVLYDLVVNTEQISVQDCVTLIKQLVRLPTFQETAESRAKVADMRLMAKVRSALRASPKTSEASPSFNIVVEPGTGRVRLTGVVGNRELAHDAEQVVLAVPGITGVDNELMAITRYLGT